MSTNMVPFNDLERMAQAVAKSGLFGVKNVEQAIAIMLVAQAEGRHPALAARDYDVIQNRPAKKAEAMLRDFLESGGKVEWHTLDDTIADATFNHPSGGTVRIAWDMKRAQAAGLGARDMWKKYPRQMLRSRTVSEGIRTVCPMATSGMYVPEEVQDILREKNITPNAGAGDDLAPDSRDRVKHVADKALEWLNQGSVGDAFAEIDNMGFDVEELRYCWTFFDSKQRRALKEESKRLRESKEKAVIPVAVITDAQKKRLEASIHEMGLDREKVKAHMKQAYGVEHFQDLSPFQYDMLDKDLPTLQQEPI